MIHRHRKPAAFTIVELMVAIVIVLILLSIFVPYLMSIREESRRLMCNDNLRQIANGLWRYINDNNQEFPRVTYDPAKLPDGYTAFTGANDDNPFNPGADPANDVKPSDVTASLFLLIRLDLVDPKAFVCPSSDDEPDRIDDRSKRSNFSSPKNLSYSYAMPFSSSPDYRFNRDRLKSTFVLLADKNPGVGDSSDPSSVSRDDGKPLDFAKANSPNHNRAGQNILDATGAIGFKSTPYCGPGDDNIYTAQASSPTTQPTSNPDLNGVIGITIGPARPDDSYLVPTATDK